jgi:hypothetical protein
MYNNLTPQNEISNRLFDAYVGYWTTAWFWPYFVMGNADAWQKMGITMNGIKPICNPK